MVQIYWRQRGFESDILSIDDTILSF